MSDRRARFDRFFDAILAELRVNRDCPVKLLAGYSKEFGGELVRDTNRIGGNTYESDSDYQ